MEAQAVPDDCALAELLHHRLRLRQHGSQSAAQAVDINAKTALQGLQHRMICDHGRICHDADFFSARASMAFSAWITPVMLSVSVSASTSIGTNDQWPSKRDRIEGVETGAIRTLQDTALAKLAPQRVDHPHIASKCRWMIVGLATGCRLAASALAAAEAGDAVEFVAQAPKLGDAHVAHRRLAGNAHLEIMPRVRHRNRRRAPPHGRRGSMGRVSPVASSGS